MTTTSITAVSVSMRKAHSASKLPDWIQRITVTGDHLRLAERDVEEHHPGQDATIIMKPVVTYSACLGADRGAEQARDQEADQRQEDDALE